MARASQASAHQEDARAEGFPEEEEEEGEEAFPDEEEEEGEGEEGQRMPSNLQIACFHAPTSRHAG